MCDLWYYIKTHNSTESRSQEERGCIRQTSDHKLLTGSTTITYISYQGLSMF